MTVGSRGRGGNEPAAGCSNRFADNSVGSRNIAARYGIPGHNKLNRDRGVRSSRHRDNPRGQRREVPRRQWQKQAIS